MRQRDPIGFMIIFNDVVVLFVQTVIAHGRFIMDGIEIYYNVRNKLISFIIINDSRQIPHQNKQRFSQRLFQELIIGQEDQITYR